nr:EAL domain-containing protein [Micromonospora sp. DSM 115978]
LDAADLAMYAAKRDGPGRALVFDETMRTRVVQRLGLTDDLRRAVASDQLRLHFEPITTADGELRGAGALLSWQHPTRGALPSAEFLPVAAEAGLTDELDWWAVESACRLAGGWAGSDWPAGMLPQVVVRVSGRQLCEPAFVADLDQLLRATGGGRWYELGLVFPDSAVLGGRASSAAWADPATTLDDLARLPVVSYVCGPAAGVAPAIHRGLALGGL